MKDSDKTKPYSVGTIVKFKYSMVAGQWWDFKGIIEWSPDTFRHQLPLEHKHEMSNEYTVHAIRTKTGKRYRLKVQHELIKPI